MFVTTSHAEWGTAGWGEWDDDGPNWVHKYININISAQYNINIDMNINL